MRTQEVQNIYFRFYFVIILILISPFSNAAEVREFYNSARQMAMGGASIAVVNDETSLLSNPAGLGKLRDYFGTILDPEVDGSYKYQGIYSASPFTQPFDLPAVAAALQGSKGVPYHMRENVFPSFVVRNFGIGIYQRYSLDAVTDATGANLTAAYYDDLALILGYNLRFFDGRIKLGFVGKIISRIEAVGTFSTATSLDPAAIASEGLGVGGDIGLTLTAPWTGLPTISAVLRDAGGTKFTNGKGLRLSTTNAPTALTQDIDVAFAFFPINSNNSRSTFTVEYQKMTEAAAATDKTRYMHYGYELNLHDVIFLRAGYNQSFWTAGLELASERTQIQIGSYGEDIGADGTPVEDRRYFFKFGFRY